jgi:hypothetical protein
MSNLSITQLKNIMKEVNEPNQFIMQPFNLNHPLYWIYRLERTRVKPIFSKLEPLRKFQARFDVFINGQFIGENDYVYEIIENDLYIKFKKSNFPIIDAEENPFRLEGGLDADAYDEIKIIGDIEQF